MEQIESDEVDRRVRETLARVFHLSAAEAQGKNLRKDHLPRWDSMGHMQLVVEIENEFGLRFPIYEIAELLSTEAIIKAVEKYARSSARA